MRLLTQISMKEGDLIDKSTDMVKRSIFFRTNNPPIFNYLPRNLQSNFYNNWIFFLHELGEGFGNRSQDEKLKSMDFWTDLYPKILIGGTSITNGYSYHRIKTKIDDSRFRNALDEYYFTKIFADRLSEARINFNSPGDGVGNFDLGNETLSEIREKSWEIFFDLQEMTNSSGERLYEKYYKEFLPLPHTKENIQEWLEDDELIIHLNSIEDNPYGKEAPVILYFMSKNDAFYKSTNPKQSFYKNSISEILNSLSPDNTNSLQPFNLREASFLYTEIFRDKWRYENKKKIYVIAEGVFKDLPLSLLFDERNNMWAFEQFDFIYLDSFASFLEVKQIEERKLTSELNYVAFADPKLIGNSRNVEFKNIFARNRGYGSSSEIDRLERIPETAEEVTLISKNFKKSHIFLGEDATEENLKSDNVVKILKNADVVSFATHAFSDTSNYTKEHGLILTPPKVPTGRDDGFLTSAEINLIELNNSQVILSACDTDQPIYEYANSYSGLITSFIEAGARNVTYTKWNIDSESAKIFMTEVFKTGVSENLSISESISLTMKKFANGNFGKNYEHPFYWAPYQVFGSR